MKIQFVIPPAATVELIDIQGTPERTIALATRGYTQIYNSKITDIEIEDMLEQVKRTKLKTPLESVQVNFLIKDVTRSFTHQLVRTRVGASYVQESMRFSDKREAKVFVSTSLKNNEEALKSYRVAVEQAFMSYEKQLSLGIPIEEARGVLPHNVLTHVFVSYTLETLAHIYEQRTCCQAQHGEWGTVIAQMRNSLPERLKEFLATPWESGAVTCGFGASFDRPCKYQNMFDANLVKLIQKRNSTGNYSGQH